jgi:hypothetical protein
MWGLPFKKIGDDVIAQKPVRAIFPKTSHNATMNFVPNFMFILYSNYQKVRTALEIVLILINVTTCQNETRATKK